MKSTLTNEQLIAKAKQWVKELCESGGRKWSLRVPVDFNHDPDVIFIELCNRLEEYAQQSQPSGMWWVRVEDYKGYDGRILVFSPIYPIRDLMRYRIIDSQFLKTCKDVTHYHILKEPSESSPAGADEVKNSTGFVSVIQNGVANFYPAGAAEGAPSDNAFMNGGNTESEKSFYAMGYMDRKKASEGMAEALRLKWINLTEDMGRLLSGQRGVSIDKLNKAMNLVQDFVNTMPASLSPAGDGGSGKV